MTWAKVIDDEVVQIFEGDPRNHWHPDLLVHWEDVPDDIGIAIGWHKKEDGTWESAEDWGAAQDAANPIPDPGPPTAIVRFDLEDDPVNNTVTITARAEIAGIWDENDPTHIPTWSWNDGADTSNDWEITMTVAKDANSILEKTISCSVVGTGGTSETEELVVTIPKSA